MISKLVSEMPGGFQAMNAYLKRNIAEAWLVAVVEAGVEQHGVWVKPAHAGSTNGRQ